MPAGAQETPPATAEALATQPAGPQIRLDSPRSTLREFLLAVSESEQNPERINDALACLDLSALDEEQRQQAGRLAEHLERAIDLILRLEGRSTEEVPEQVAGDTYEFYRADGQAVALRRTADGRWLFSAATVRHAAELRRTLEQRVPENQSESPLPESVRPEFRSARATMRTFIEAMNAGNKALAAECLDLSGLTGLEVAARAETGADLATKLMYAMDRIQRVVYQEIPDDPAGEPYTWFVSPVGRVELARLEEGERAGEWRFSKRTVGTIEALFKFYEDKPLAAGLEHKRIKFLENPQLWLRERIPPAWKQTRFVWFEDWQWLALLIVLLAGWIVHRAVLPLLEVAARPLVRTRYTEVSPQLLHTTLRPVGLLVMVLVWWAGVRLLGLSTGAQAVLLGVLKLLATAVAVWAAYRLIDLVMQHWAARAAVTATRLDDVLVPLLRKTLKVAVVAFGIIFVARALGARVDALLAGVGLGGLALGLAAQDTLKNFFGSVNVVLDRPFQVGDWVKVGDIEGTVESVGLRSTRIRTFYNSEVTVPNAEIMNARIDNMGRRRYRRIRCYISVTYSTTPEQLEAFCEGIRELIRRHPYTRKDYYHVYVNQFAASSIDILLYCFHETPDWGTELRERHRLFVDIVRLAKRLGVEFAFPTQTVHLHHESSPPAEPPPPPPSPPPDPQQAQRFGRDEAAAIVRELLGDPPEKPPPVRF